MVKAFSNPSLGDADLAASHLASLARLANENGRNAEAARRTYRRAFEVVASWPKEVRRSIFGGTLVPTEAGGWRSGREVIEDGAGVALSHRLRLEYASLLRKHTVMSASRMMPDGVSNDPPAAGSPAHETKVVDLAELELQTADQQRRFLNAWRGRVPSDLVIIYLGLIGRYAALKQLAIEWTADATTNLHTLWEDLDRHFPNYVLSPNSLSAEVDQRRFSLEIILVLRPS